MGFRTHLESIAFDYAHITLICVCRDHSDDRVEDRYSVIVEFEDQKSADRSKECNTYLPLRLQLSHQLDLLSFRHVLFENRGSDHNLIDMFN